MQTNMKQISHSEMVESIVECAITDAYEIGADPEYILDYQLNELRADAEKLLQQIVDPT